MFIYIFQYLASFTYIYQHFALLLAIFTLICPNLTIYAIFTLHRYSSSEIKAIRQLIMEMLPLKLCDLKLTFRVPKCSKISRQAERLHSRAPLLRPPLGLAICGRNTDIGTCGHSCTCKVMYMVALNMHKCDIWCICGPPFI